MKSTFSSLVTADRINFIFNYEVVRDFCGGFYNEAYNATVDPHAPSVYVYYLPKAIRTLVKEYHFFANNNSDEEVKLLSQTVTEWLDGIIPLDSDKWDDRTIMLSVYNRIYVDCPIAEQLKVAAESIIDSDFNKAKRFAKSIEDPELAVIIDKAIHGHKPSHVDINFHKMDEAREKQKLRAKFK